MSVQYTGHVIQTETCDNNNALPLVGVLVTCSGPINNIINYIKNEKLSNSNKNKSKLEFLGLQWDIIVLRLVA